MFIKNALLFISFLIVNSLGAMQNSYAREKVVQDRVLLQCALGALSTNLSETFAIDTPENRTATLTSFRLLLRNEAKSLANPELLCKDPEDLKSITPTKLNHSVRAHFKSTKINEEMLAQWSRKHGNLTQIPIKQLIDLISARLK